jgi:hypothetical protein
MAVKTAAKIPTRSIAGSPSLNVVVPLACTTISPLNFKSSQVYGNSFRFFKVFHKKCHTLFGISSLLSMNIVLFGRK